MNGSAVFKQGTSFQGTIASPKADYAEFFKVNDDAIEACDVVAVVGKNITRDTSDPTCPVGIVSETPTVQGDTPSDEATRQNGRPVAWMGKVRVKVVGPAKVGDRLVPSGRNDGTAARLESGSSNQRVLGLVIDDEAGQSELIPLVMVMVNGLGSAQDHSSEHSKPSASLRAQEEPAVLGEAFGQHEPLTTRLRNILEDYDGLASVLRELVQNADDACAQKIRIVLDRTEFGTQLLLDEKMAAFQGPALYVYNDREFEEKDFYGICHLGASNKRLDSSTIGNFGLGFNTVYTLTDMPSFLTGEYVYVPARCIRR